MEQLEGDPKRDPQKTLEELLRLEKTSQVLKSSHQFSTTSELTTKASPRVPYPCVFNTSRDGDLTASLDRLFQCLTTLSVRNFLPNI